MVWYNELEMGFIQKSHELPLDEYIEFFDSALPSWIRNEDPDTPYWPGSPHSPLGERTDPYDPNSGDAHYWSVFFGNESIESQRNWRCRFMSEYGFQSLPNMRTIERITEPADRSLNSRIMDYHQRSEVGNKTMLSYAADWYPTPRNFAETIRVTQWVQALCIRYAAEHLRNLPGVNEGCLFWQLNDTWSCPSWSSVDADGRWKVAHYDVARAFAPVLVSLHENIETHHVALNISNHTPAPLMCTVYWQISTTDGAIVHENSDNILIGAQKTQCIHTIDCHALGADWQPEDLLISAWTSTPDGITSRAIVSLVKPKHLSLRDPELTLTHGTDTHGNYIDCHAQFPALLIHLEHPTCDCWWSDNDFFLNANETRRVYLRRHNHSEPTTPNAQTICSEIVADSLVDMMVSPRTQLVKPKPPGYRQWVKR